ncbi:MAG: SRPBCC family protein [Planctomycetes bacterium]|nr:SRPBCC family protein [Planctomycetota bacterium]
MATVRTQIDIDAPLQRVFDAARDITLHVESQAGAKERAVAGVTSGLIGLEQEVTFEARHFGFRLRHTSRIVEFEPPHRFVDSMVRGVFASFVHEHRFEATPRGTLMVDVLEYSAPLGPLGRLAEWLFLNRYLFRLLRDKAQGLKLAVEESTRFP